MQIRRQTESGLDRKKAGGDWPPALPVPPSQEGDWDLERELMCVLRDAPLIRPAPNRAGILDAQREVRDHAAHGTELVGPKH